VLARCSGAAAQMALNSAVAALPQIVRMVVCHAVEHSSTAVVGDGAVAREQLY